MKIIHSINSFQASKLLVLLLLGISLVGCHPFDKTQVPKVTVGKGLTPVFTFEPPNAFFIRVYKGDKDLDGYSEDMVWDLTGTGGTNSLTSPIIYGQAPPNYHQSVPADPLLAGETYTAVIYRMDPKATGDGFTRRSNDYRGVITFVAVE